MRDVSFAVRRGEVLGMAGLMGAGRTELARLIFGADRKKPAKSVSTAGAVKIDSPRDAIANGICLLTEDRKSARSGARGHRARTISPCRIFDPGRAWVHQPATGSSSDSRSTWLNLNIRIAGPEQRAEELSGGNQQKLLVARWLETNSQVIIFDEPTRGIDVGAKYEMYLLINELAAQGKGDHHHFVGTAGDTGNLRPHPGDARGTGRRRNR